MSPFSGWRSLLQKVTLPDKDKKKKHDVHSFIWNYFDSKKAKVYICFSDVTDKMKGTNTSTNISHALACFKSEFLSTPSKSRLACSFEKASPSIQLYVFHPQWNGFSSSMKENFSVVFGYFGEFIQQKFGIPDMKLFGFSRIHFQGQV